MAADRARRLRLRRRDRPQHRLQLALDDQPARLRLHLLKQRGDDPRRRSDRGAGLDRGDRQRIDFAHVRRLRLSHRDPAQQPMTGYPRLRDLLPPARRRVREAARAARARLAQERGVALVAALSALLVILLLSAAAAAVSMQTNHYANRDYHNKNALEAAEAGLQVALYRLNMLQPADGNCIGDAVASPGTDGWCQSSTTTLGNGSSYQYYTTPVLAGGSTCAGYTVSDSSSSVDGVSNRCITAVGTSNGVTARSQIRAAAFTPREAFPAGITG